MAHSLDTFVTNVNIALCQWWWTNYHEMHWYIMWQRFFCSTLRDISNLMWLACRFILCIIIWVITFSCKYRIYKFYTMLCTTSSLVNIDQYIIGNIVYWCHQLLQMVYNHIQCYGINCLTLWIIVYPFKKRTVTFGLMKQHNA